MCVDRSGSGVLQDRRRLFARASPVAEALMVDEGRSTDAEVEQ